MTSLLFENVQSQYIDNNGKTRMLSYTFQGEELCLMTSPIPPLDLPSTKDIIETPIQTALAFIQQKGLKITQQDGNETQGIQGLWIETKEENPGIYYGYIPIKVSRPLKSVEYATKNDPIRTDASSDMTTFRKSRKIAEFLKQYTLFSYAADPENFGEDSFIIIPDHEYDIYALNKRLIKDTEVMYDNGLLIVPSEAIKQKLLSFLKVSLVNDTSGVMAMANASTIENYYQTISDFRTSENQLVFLNKTGLQRWRNESARMEHSTKVSNSVNSDTMEPYFYRNPEIRREHLMIVQNVADGAMENALAVGYKWIKDRVNIGYRPLVPNNVEDFSYVVYTENGEVERIKHKTTETVSLLKQDDVYSALLFFN